MLILTAGVCLLCVYVCVQEKNKKKQGNNPNAPTNQVNPCQKSLYALQTKLSSWLRLQLFLIFLFASDD